MGITFYNDRVWDDRDSDMNIAIWVIGIIILAVAGWVAYTVTVSYLKNQNSN
jgi:hypothetical protein